MRLNKLRTPGLEPPLSLESDFILRLNACTKYKFLPALEENSKKSTTTAKLQIVVVFAVFVKFVAVSSRQTIWDLALLLPDFRRLPHEFPNFAIFVILFMLLIGVFHINRRASSMNFSSNLPLTGLFCNETVSSQKCSNLGLKSTFVSGSVQGQFKRSLNATMNRLVKLVKSPQCQIILEKLACASYTPQCEGHKMTTLCLSECDQLRDDCPEALNASEISSYCAEPADGNSESGFCELKTWPSARYWYKGTVYALVLLSLV